MTRAEFDALITKHYRDLERFAYWLGGGSGWLDGGPDSLQDALTRLLHTGAYLKYQYTDTTRIPQWLSRAVAFDVRANRAKLRRRNRLLREDLEEQIHLKLLTVAAEGFETDSGYVEDGNLELARVEPDALAKMIADEEADTLDRELSALAPATAAGIVLVLGEGMSWHQAGGAVGVPAGALRKRVERALPELRERLVSAFRDAVNYVGREPHSFAPTAQRGTRR
jgi:DNA-directed RNA polymerase specialized sigma24 family protein